MDLEIEIADTVLVIEREHDTPSHGVEAGPASFPDRLRQGRGWSADFFGCDDLDAGKDREDFRLQGFQRIAIKRERFGGQNRVGAFLELEQDQDWNVPGLVLDQLLTCFKASTSEGVVVR